MGALSALAADPVRRALAAGDVGGAEDAWQALSQEEPGDTGTWTLGVSLAGWRGDRAAALERERLGRDTLAEAATPWLERHRLALAAGQAALRAGELRAALPLFGEALGQTEWQPGHPAAIDALLGMATLHALYAAPRKAASQVARAIERSGTRWGHAPAAAYPVSAWSRSARAHWVSLVVGVRTQRLPRERAARRATHLASGWRLADCEPQFLQLQTDSAVLAGDDARAEQLVERARGLGLGGVEGRARLLRDALSATGERRRG